MEPMNSKTIKPNTPWFGPQAPTVLEMRGIRFADLGGDGSGAGDGGDGGASDGKGDETFTKDDVERIVKDRLAQQAKNKFGDYNDLKAKAAGAQTVEQKLADLEQKHAAAETRALRSDIAAKHSISAEDRDLFLTGSDEATLTAQAERLAAREGDRKKQGNHAPREGNNPSSASDPTGLRDVARSVFGTVNK